jgi:hypothetical protein
VAASDLLCGFLRGHKVLSKFRLVLAIIRIKSSRTMYTALRSSGEWAPSVAIS